MLVFNVSNGTNTVCTSTYCTSTSTYCVSTHMYCTITSCSNSYITEEADAH